MQVVLFVPNNYIEEFIITKTVPEGIFVYGYEPKWESIGSYSQVIVSEDEFRYLKKEHKLKYNIPAQ